MDGTKSRRDFAAKLSVAALFLGTPLIVAAFLEVPLPLPRIMSNLAAPEWIAARASLLLFVSASILLFLRPRFGYAAGLLAGFAALPLFVRVELTLRPWNSWIFLNEEDGFLSVPLRILSLALIVSSIAVAFLRLLPTYWLFRGSPVCRRTWPAFALALLVLAGWFVHSVTPYSVAAYDHPAHLEFRILHLEKHGLQLHETTIEGYRDGRFRTLRHDRRLFQYRFAENGSVIPAIGDEGAWQMAVEHAREFVKSPQLWNLHTRPAKSLWSWNAEGWYVVLKDSRLLAFSSEYGTKPPDDVIAIFREIEKLPALRYPFYHVQDVCFGFCYDPLAALDFTVLAQRRRLLESNNSVTSGGL